MEDRRSIVVDGGPARGRLRSAVVDGPPVDGWARVLWADLALTAAIEAGAPRWVSMWWRAVAAGVDVDGVDALLAWTSSAAWLRGWSRRSWSATLAPWLGGVFGDARSALRAPVP